MTSDYLANPDERQLSSILLEKIDTCVSKFKNHIVAGSELQNSINEVYAQAESEGVPKDVIRDIIWNKMISAGFSDRTVRRHLPDALKRSGGYNERSDKGMGTKGHLSFQKTPAQAAIEFKNRMSQQPEPEPTTKEQHTAAIEEKYGIAEKIPDSVNYHSQYRENIQLKQKVEQQANKTDELTKQNEEQANEIEQIKAKLKTRNWTIYDQQNEIEELKTKLKQYKSNPSPEAAAA